MVALLILTPFYFYLILSLWSFGAIVYAFSHYFKWYRFKSAWLMGLIFDLTKCEFGCFAEIQNESFFRCRWWEITPVSHRPVLSDQSILVAWWHECGFSLHFSTLLLFSIHCLYVHCTAYEPTAWTYENTLSKSRAPYVSPHTTTTRTTNVFV